MNVILQLAQRHNTLRVNDVDSSAKAVNVTLTLNEADRIASTKEVKWNQATREELLVSSPFVRGHLPCSSHAEGDAALTKLASRSVMIQRVGEVWASSTTIDDLMEQVRALCGRGGAKEAFCNDAQESSFRVDVHVFGRKFNRRKFVTEFGDSDVFPFFGRNPVDMENPSVVFAFWLDFGVSELPMVKGVPKPLLRCHFVRHVADGDGRHVVDRYNLPARPYIGSTSMDPELAFLSASQALVGPTSLVADPFVGTGSMLVSCAHYGAKCMGFDIDMRVLRGRPRQTDPHGPVRNLQSNFDHYGFTGQLLDVMLFDVSHAALMTRPIFDAIVTDPPYGVRAGAKKVGKTKKTREKEAQGIEHVITDEETHFMQCVGYSVVDSCADLLALAARTLVVGGRLVYWLPTTHEFQPSDLPLHPCLVVVCHGMQILNKVMCRVLVTMEKVVAYDPEQHASPPASALGQFGSPAHAGAAFDPHKEQKAQQQAEAQKRSKRTRTE